MADEIPPEKNFMRTPHAAVLMKLRYTRDYAGRMVGMSFAAENAQYVFENDFDILPPGIHDGADFILTVLPDQMFVTHEGKLKTERNRMHLCAVHGDAEYVIYDDHKNHVYELFRNQCSALGSKTGAGLKAVAIKRTPKEESFRKERQPPTPE